MSAALLLVAALASVNAPRVRAALPAAGAAPVAALGALATWAALVPLAAFARPVADALHVPGPTARMAVGTVLVVIGLAQLVAVPPPAPEPALPGRLAALVPLAFPVLLHPGTGLLVLSASLDRGAPAALLAAGAALATVPLVALAWPSGGPLSTRLAGAAARAVELVLLAVGVALLVNGLYDI